MGGPAASCVIDVAVEPHGTARLLRTVLAHEVFHAYEADMSLTAANWTRRPQPEWLIEGAAEWAEASLFGSDDPIVRGWRADYFEHPSRPLFSRTYDGVGFLSHMQFVGLSPWQRFKVPFATTSNVSAYNNALGGDTNSSSPKPPSSSGNPPAGPGPSALRASPFPAACTSPAHAQRRRRWAQARRCHAAHRRRLHLTLHLATSKPILEVVVKSGKVRIHSTPGATVDQVVVGDVKLCTARGGCDCPGQAENYPHYTQGDLAIAAGLGRGEVEFIVRKRCEPLLAQRSCEGAFPGYSNKVISGRGTPRQTP